MDITMAVSYTHLDVYKRQIKYDAELTSKTKDREINDIIRKDMLGRTTFKIGRAHV